MRKYRNKYNEINNIDIDDSKYNPKGEYPSYQVSREYHQKELPNGYERSHRIFQKMQRQDPHNKNSKISSKSEKYYSLYTEESSPKVNLEGNNTAKKYMNKRAYTPSRNMNDSGYISDLREDYSNMVVNNRVNIRKKVYTGNKTPQPYRTNDYQENRNEEEFLDNYGFHESKDIKNKGHNKYDSITHITGYSNLIPLNRLKQCGRIETYNYSNRKEQENKPNFKSAIEKVRELQRGKREYDEFMRKLGKEDPNEDKIENYKKEQLRQQEIREEKIRIERMRIERIREEQMRNEKLRQEKLRQEKLRQERIKKEEEMRQRMLQREKIRQEELRQIKIREEKIRQEKIRQEKIKQQEKQRQQEKIKKEIKQEKIIKKEEKPKNVSKQKVESYKKIVINTQGSSKARSDSIKKQFKAHSGKYTYKDNINEEISHYRNNSNYNKDQKNVARKETIYKNKITQKKETNKSYSQLPIKININKTTSYSRNQSSKNLKTETDYSVKNKQTNINNKNQTYQIKTTKTSIVTNNTRSSGRKNSLRSSNNNSINTDKFKNNNITNYISQYTKQSYKSNNSYTNISKNNYPNKSDNYRKVRIAEKTSSLNYPNPHIKVDTYGPNYKGELYHKDYVNIENVSHGKIANHIHTGLSKDGQYLINMTSAEKILDENAMYEMPEKNVEEIISTVKERKKNLGDNYAFYESKHLQKPDNSSYTIHKRFGERTIFGKEKYETKKVRHYKIKSGEEGKYFINDNDINDMQNYNENNNMVEYGDCGYGCMERNNNIIDVEEGYENDNYDYSPEGQEGQEEYENRVEEYNYESY